MSTLIELSDIHFSYADGTKPLNGINLSLSQGERIAVNGPNGAGKSTLFHIMVGLIKPSRGSLIMFNQERKTEDDFYEVRRKTGLVFQDPDDQLFCPTVSEDLAFGLLNLGFGLEAVQEKITQTLCAYDLDHLKDRATHNLSGGEKRLISLLSVLIMEPDVLLLDEPTNALDEHSSERLREILKNLSQSLVLISHDSAFRQGLVETTYNLENGQLHLSAPSNTANTRHIAKQLKSL